VQVFGDAAVQEEKLTPRRKGAKRRRKKMNTLRSLLCDLAPLRERFFEFFQRLAAKPIGAPGKPMIDEFRFASPISR